MAARSTAAPPVRVLAALLCLGVASIHVLDQDGFPGDKEPRYVGIGYYILEVTAVLTAVLLVAARGRRGTLLAGVLTLGVGLFPIVGYMLSRGPGLPDYDDDRGNWTESLGLASLVVEGVLVLLALVILVPVVRSLAGNTRHRERHTR